MRNKRGNNFVLPRVPADLTEQLVEKLMNLRPSVKSDYLKKHLMSQYVSPSTVPGMERRSAAIAKWLKSEEINEATNERLTLTPGEYNILPRVSLKRFMRFCRNEIISVIGELPPIEVLIGSFSGGASTSRARTSSFPAGKYVGKAHVTDRCVDMFTSIGGDMPAWLNAQSSLRLEIVRGNVLFTVPKKTEIDRVACKEPDLNMFCQKGIGSYFRRALLRTGINLNDQSINRKLAHIGSVTDELSTLDLSSASDSVTRELVFSLLPVFWFTLLDSVRSPVTIIDGEEHLNEMFSSMGNGFTFELESLLFYAIARTTAYFTGTRGIVSVYGDDIICPKGMAQDLTWVLNFFGFRINTDKSCYEGPLRESCGGHYYNGIDITPFYIKEPISDLVELISVANKLRRWAHWIPESTVGQNPMVGLLDPEVEPIWLWLKSFIPDDFWGGVDTTFKYQLVSNDTPRYRIHPVSKTVAAGPGGYPHWHNATWEREHASDGVQTSTRSVETYKYRKRRARISTVDRLRTLFSSELG